MSKRYYNTCVNCGANLDPNETCDCSRNIEEQKTPVSEVFLVSFDASVNDLSCLQISKVTNGTMKVTNIYFGEEAELLYNKLEEKV